MNYVCVVWCINSISNYGKLGVGHIVFPFTHKLFTLIYTDFHLLIKKCSIELILKYVFSKCLEYNYFHGYKIL